MKEEKFAVLTQLLDEEMSLYDQLKEILAQKQQSIIDSEIPKLRELTSLEQSVMRDIRLTGKKREEYVRYLADLLRMNKKNPRLKELIDFAPAEIAIKLKNMRLQLQEKMTYITQAAQQTSFLLEFSIRHIRQLIHIFMQTDNTPNELYNLQGLVHNNEVSNKMFDFQI